MRRGLTLAALGLVLAAGDVRTQTPAPPADSQAATDPALERQVRDVASMLRCPVCLNLSVYDSPSELARDMRDLVRERLASGETEEQVFAYFVQRYGDWVLMKPPARGVNWFVWLLPGVLVVGGAVLVILVVRRWVSNQSPALAEAEEVPEEDLRRVREELSKVQEPTD